MERTSKPPTQGRKPAPQADRFAFRSLARLAHSSELARLHNATPAEEAGITLGY